MFVSFVVSFVVSSLFNRCLIVFSLLFHCFGGDSCDGADRVTAFISVSGNKEKIDDFCGSTTPRELMSNSATMSLHFHSTPVSKGARGFKARYAFVSSEWRSLFIGLTRRNPRPDWWGGGRGERWGGGGPKGKNCALKPSRCVDPFPAGCEVK